MKKRGRILVVLSTIGIFSYMFLPGMKAEIFDIGEKIRENEFGWYSFSSGVVVSTSADYIIYVPLIFDGNESTGIDHDFGPGHEYMDLSIYFPYPYNINNITIKPTFGGNASTYYLNIRYKNGFKSFGSGLSGQKTFQINCSIDSITLSLDSNGTNHFYFNDIIINYTPVLTEFSEIQNQINDLKQQFNLLNNNIIELNNSISELNQTQSEIIENISDLHTTYKQLNESFVNFTDKIEKLNNSILLLESENVALKLEIENLTTKIENLTLELEILKNTEKEKIIEKQPDNSLVYGAFILGILGIIIALVAIFLISKKLGSQKSSIEKEESKDSSLPKKTLNETEDEEL